MNGYIQGSTSPSLDNGWVRFRPALSRKVGQISTGVDRGARHHQRGGDYHSGLTLPRHGSKEGNRNAV